MSCVTLKDELVMHSLNMAHISLALSVMVYFALTAQSNHMIHLLISDDDPKNVDCLVLIDKWHHLNREIESFVTSIKGRCVKAMTHAIPVADCLTVIRRLTMTTGAQCY